MRKTTDFIRTHNERLNIVLFEIKQNVVLQYNI